MSAVRDFTKQYDRTKQNIYVESPVVIEEDFRTRYVYSPVVTLSGQHIVEREWSVVEIPKGQIVKVAKRSYLDSGLDAAQVVQFAKLIDPNAAIPAGLSVRRKLPGVQVKDILHHYAKFAVTELVSPLAITDADLPVGWSVEDAVTVLDFVLHPQEGGLRTPERLEYLEKRAIEQLEGMTVTDSSGRALPLPDGVKALGYKLREELIGACNRGLLYQQVDWDSTVAEMTDRHVGGLRGKGRLDPRDIEVQQDMGFPTPKTRQMDFDGKNNEANAQMMNMFERALNRVADSRMPVAAPVDEEAMTLRAAEMASSMNQESVDERARQLIKSMIESGDLVIAAPKKKAEVEVKK